MTNYDTDEFILPRHLDRDFHETIEFDLNFDCNDTWRNVTTQIEHKKPNFNLYNYVVKLIDKYGPNVAHFEFDHFLYVSQFEYLFEMIANNSIEINKNGDRSLVYMHTNTILRFKVPNSKFKYFRHLKRLKTLIKCLNETYLFDDSSNQTKLHFKWSNSLMMPFTSRPGKSIFNTNYTISINQHNGNLQTPKSRTVNVDSKLGFVSHMRDQDPYFLNKVMFSLSDLKVDVEYLYFLIVNRKIFSL